MKGMKFLSVLVLLLISFLLVNCSNNEKSNENENHIKKEKSIKEEKERKRLEKIQTECEKRNRQANARYNDKFSHKIEKWKLKYKRRKWRKEDEKESNAEYNEYLKRKAKYEEKYGPLDGYSNYINCVQAYRKLVGIYPEDTSLKLKLSYYLAQEVGNLNSTDIEGNLKIYRELVELSPKNTYYQNKLKEYEEKLANIQKKKNSYLELETWFCYAGSGFKTIKTSGSVKNISNKSLNNVIAVVDWYTEDGQMINSKWAFIDYRPLFAGDTSHFEVVNPYNPAMGSTSIKFKFFSGEEIPTYIPDDVNPRRP